MVILVFENVSVEDIVCLVECGVKVFIGYINVDFVIINVVFVVGVDGFIYLFNVMLVFILWELGVVGVVFWDDNSWCGLIVDGYYVYFLLVKLVICSK